MTWATVAGICIVITAALGLIFLIPFVVVVFHPSSKHKTSFFILAGWLGIADGLCLLLMIGYAAPSTIMEQNLAEIKINQTQINKTLTDKRVNAIMGGLLNVGWFSSLPLIVFAAVDQWLCFCHRQCFNSVFTQQRTQFYICACWVFGISYSMPSFMNCCPLYFWFDLISWGWSLDHSGSAVLAIGELVITILVFTITYLCNAMVLR